MADGHHPQPVALSSAAQVLAGVAAAATGVVGGDRRPHMNYRRPRVSKPNYCTCSILMRHLSNISNKCIAEA